MNTEDKRFQDALHNLTTAFYNFLDVVNPGSASRADDIRYIAQTIQNLAAHLGPLADARVWASPNEPASSHIAADARLETRDTPSPHQDTKARTFSSPNWRKAYCRKPIIDSDGSCIFKGLCLEKAEYVTDMPFCFEVDSTSGEGTFEVKITTREEWRNAFEHKNEVLLNSAVVVEGTIGEQCECRTLERGKVRLAQGSRQKWSVVKPCTITVSPVNS